ncbi:hypothetical protein JCM19232_5408 [Vibrio ishigakensis]|uniref:Uncharacterized protein n=1 Tax=Vibrio ishigakensis TaxID=1481914 RepID=A0A0B8PMA1_9VIBR|nr:hypothetical protein JCM19232_5408 [Vibrio ishigakensis]
MSFFALTGCTHNQSKALNVNTSSVNVYPQYMTNLQLCDTLYYNRATNQTKAAIGSEFNRRKLSKSWCQRETNKLYLTKTVHWIVKKSKTTKPKKNQPQFSPSQNSLFLLLT